MPEAKRILIVSPVRNEARHIELTAAAMAGQTRRPDRWVVVDDNSDDDTPRLLSELAAELPFMEMISKPVMHAPGVSDRHAAGAAPRAFNWALRRIDWSGYSHLGKLDGDIELPPDYFERLLDRFSEQPRLGIAGGALTEPGRGGWKLARIPAYHVRGALKLYSRECFEAIGGVQERLGWDTIDETYARMLGYETRSFGHIVARHHRPLGSADGQLRGRARYGQAAYVLRYGFGWVALRSLKVALSRPFGLSGAAFLAGYLRAAALSEPKVEDEDFRRFVRGELQGRIFSAPSSLAAQVSPRRPRSSIDQKTSEVRPG